MLMIPKIFVYGLTDPRTDDVRYIGKTVRGLERPKMHGTVGKLAKDRTHKAHWIRQLKSLGLEYGIRVLEETSMEKLSSAEQRWILYGRDHHWPLTNLTDGGEGLHGHVFSEQHKARLSAAQKGRARHVGSGRKATAIIETTTCRKFESLHHAATELGLTPTRVRDVLVGKFSQAGGFHFIRDVEIVVPAEALLCFPELVIVS